ncbi:FucT6, partial [Symbiodinium pilosum]
MDEELLRDGWNSTRYPWRFLQQSGGVPEEFEPEILYGTAYAQQLIWNHQHPKNCSEAKFLVYYHQVCGIGAQLHLLGQALAIAMQLGRVLVSPDDDPAVLLVDPSFCPGEKKGWQCWLENLTSCQEIHGDILTVSGLPQAESLEDLWRQPTRRSLIFEGTYGIQHVPDIFQDLLACSPVKRRFWFYWWRAQSVTYLLRFNAKTRL